MTRVPLLLLCTIFQLLAQSVKALNAAGAAETTFFYQAYLLELEHVTDPTRRAIAPGCHEDNANPPCTFAKFVEHISSDEALEHNSPKWNELSAIFDAAENTPLVETSRKLREAGFYAHYEQERLYPKDKEAKSLTHAIRKMRGIAVATKKNKFVDQKTKMIEALELAAEVRRADNMRYFIPTLEQKMGIKMELKETMSHTRDGLKYQAYDEAKTAEKNKGVEDLAQKIVTAADKLRKQKRKGAAPGEELDFVIHQGVMREIEESIGQLKQKCP